MGDKNTKKTLAYDGADTSAQTASALKVMSNPIRMRILATLRINGAQTIGDISNHLNEAPGAVSYHMLQLEQAGLVVKVQSPDGDKRKSWWQAAQQEVHIQRSLAQENPEEDLNMDIFQRAAALSYQMAYERYLDHLSSFSSEWVEACTSDDHVLHLTPAQVTDMIAELNSVISKWQEVSDRQSDNSHDVETVALVLQAFRWIP
ncbi:ArsR/SmtB family transcription factor [Alloscardovia omnicolens]|uniref:ArsR/SmtB family transcription factor n=1 Tax=Alloscardovia omnicolens TaxID=419015 RepID=UPI003A6E610A